MLAACATRGPAWRAVRQHAPPLVVAHRGASAGAPENTLAAFRAAIAAGAPAAECDVRLSADAAVVVLHDPTLDRTTNGRGAVASTTLAELRALDAGAWVGPTFAGERIPELHELLALTAGRLVLFVELKDADGVEERVAALLAARPRRDDVVLIAFDPERLARAKTLLPEVPTLLLARRRIGRPPAELLEPALEVGAAAVGVEYAGLDPTFIDAAHDAGLGIFAWTVDDIDSVHHPAAAGVDGIITNRPAEVAAALSPALSRSPR